MSHLMPWPLIGLAPELERARRRSRRSCRHGLPRGKIKEVAAMLKAIHAQEDRAAAREKAQAVVEKLAAMRLGQAVEIVRAGETLSYRAFPREHWTRIHTNNVLERIMREIRRRTRVVGNFPDQICGLETRKIRVNARGAGMCPCKRLSARQGLPYDRSLRARSSVVRAGDS